MSASIGGFNRQSYDNCAYQKRLHESTSPLDYKLYFGAYENCHKCRADKFYVRHEPSIVNIESELKNLTRPLSNCDQFKYDPGCGKTGLCTSTFHASVPVIFAPEVCPIVHNNLPKVTHTGRRFPDTNICKR